MKRYKKENLLLVGIADHEPKDNNTDFFDPIVHELEKLGVEGISGVENSPKAFLFLVTADLPAKKKVIFMEQFSIFIQFYSVFINNTHKMIRIIQIHSIITHK